MKGIITSLKIIIALLVCGFLLFIILLNVNSSGCEHGDYIDFPKQVDVINDKDKTYYLYVRTVGFQEKTDYFELYEGEPKFDACNYSHENLLYEIYYDDYPKKQYVKSLSLDLDNPEKLKIIYTEDREQGFSSPYSVKFSPLSE